MKLDEYKCSMCKKVYQKGWTEEEAKKEYEKNFGVSLDQVEVALVCDTCYSTILN